MKSPEGISYVHSCQCWSQSGVYLFNLVLVHVEDLFLLRQLSILSIRLLKHCQHLRRKPSIL